MAQFIGSDMLVSVIIPMYNAEKSIERCLRSVFQQTYQEPMEIIVINDGSEDNSAGKVKKIIQENNRLNCKIRLIEQVNGGVSKARNAGFASCSGDLIALLDADDVWAPPKLQIQVDILKKAEDIDFLGCARNDEKLYILGKRITSLHKASVLELLIKMYPQTSTAIFKRKLYLNYGGYDENLTHGEDGDLWIRYCASSNFYYFPDSLVFTGDGKRSFGESGLSADLEKMQRGNELNLLMAKRNLLINLPTFLLLFLYSRLKYLRRVLITNLVNR